LLEEQEEREFLITKLEWKVKELAKDIKNNHTQLYTNQTTHTNNTQLYSNNTTPMAKVKDLSKIDSKS
jgi:hypothetical protein